MIWNSWSDFWAMGGYGVYVWSSFGVTAVLMALETVWVKQARDNALSKLAQTLPASETKGKDWQG